MSQIASRPASKSAKRETTQHSATKAGRVSRHLTPQPPRLVWLLHKAGYLDTAFDFFVGYDLCEDICYVYSMSEIIGNRTWKAMDSSAAERWDKLL